MSSKTMSRDQVNRILADLREVETKLKDQLASIRSNQNHANIQRELNHIQDDIVWCNEMLNKFEADNGSYQELPI